MVMVLGGMAPLFLLLAIRGNTLLPEWWSEVVFISFAVVPNALMGFRFLIAKRDKDERPLVVGSSQDHRAHLITYLFAMLLPFYRQEFSAVREMAALGVALVFIVFLFWHLHLHYINIIFAVRGYRVFTISPLGSNNPYEGKDDFVLITKRQNLSSGEQVVAIRMTDSVYWEQR